MGFSLENTDFQMSSTMANMSTPSLDQPSDENVNTSLSVKTANSTLLQVNDDCLMPTYESKAVIQKTPKKILQGICQNPFFPNFTK